MKITNGLEYNESSKALHIQMALFIVTIQIVSESPELGFNVTVRNRGGSVLDQSQFRINPLITAMLKRMLMG